jgi:cation diffusion facilitator CzcD-associated flavoprotein CzcO
VVLERADDVGGTLHYNTYPGCRCDVPSHLYSLSFAPNPNWSETYSPQAEIREYLRRCADEFEIRPHLRTNVEVESATWSAQSELWEIDTSAGRFTATVLVSGMGPLTEPMIPKLPGLERFEGKTMHSARWDHDYELRGKLVASIGTGASAIQYVPEIRREVERLYVFQRTAPGVMPHGVRPITDLERALYRRVPLEKVARSHMRKQISDPELLEKVTPDYTIGCKRMLPSNRWYQALGEANVERYPRLLAADAQAGPGGRSRVTRVVPESPRR